jgi:predicted XRE-type DNA-binding protein
MANPAHDDADARVEHGTGDIFADLGMTLTQEDRLKIELARRISRAISELALTQSEAAARAGIDQAKISSITRGRLDGFSLSRLLSVLTALGVDVEMSFKPSESATGSIRIERQQPPEAA